MYKVKNNLCHERICTIFQLNNSPYNLRKGNFFLPRFNRVAYGKHSLPCLNPKLWNSFPLVIRNSTPLNKFKGLGPVA